MDHGATGTGEVLAIQLRPGNAGSNTATDRIQALREGFKQRPGYQPGTRPRKSVLAHTDGAGCTHQLVDWLYCQRVQYSIDYTLPSDAGELIEQVPEQCWAPAWDAEGETRERVGGRS